MLGSAEPICLTYPSRSNPAPASRLRDQDDLLGNPQVISAWISGAALVPLFCCHRAPLVLWESPHPGRLGHAKSDGSLTILFKHLRAPGRRHARWPLRQPLWTSDGIRATESGRLSE